MLAYSRRKRRTRVVNDSTAIRLDWARIVDTIARLGSNETVKYMFSSRKILTACSVFLLSTVPAWAVQINLSSDSIDQYFRVLEQYVLPLMVVSTVVLFCGYLASRIFHRTVSRRQDGTVERRNRTESPVDGTAAFLRELKTSPPIVEPGPEPDLDIEPEVKQEPKLRPQHPLLRRRNAAAKADRDRQVETQAQAQQPQAPAPSVPRSTASTESSTVRSEGSQIPRLQAAFRRPGGAPAEKGPVADDAEAKSEQASVSRAAAPRDAELQEPRLRPVTVNGENTPSAPGDTAPTDRGEADGDDSIPDRREPTISVVQALKANTAQPQKPVASAAARARAVEIVDSLDYIASVMQQGSVVLAERIKNKQGLSQQDVAALRISGFDEPQNVMEDLHKLGGDAAQEVLSAYSAVSAFNNIVQRLEQMSESAELDEGWNELVRSRISETIYAVGQVRKTLGIYRRSVKKPANSENKPGTAGNTPEGGTGGSMPIGRRQV